MTRAETTNEHTLLDIGGLKHDLRELRVYVDEQFRRLEAKMDTRFGVLETSMRTEFRVLWAAGFGLAGILAKGFHWF